MRVETAHDNAERSKPSSRIFGKRHGTREACGCGDNRGGVCLDGATSFVNAGRDRRERRQALIERYPVSRHHQSRDSRRARVPSAGWSGSDLRSAIVRHLSLSLFKFASAPFRSATCCSARSARRRNSASGAGPLGVSGFDGAEDDAAAVASVCMGRCLSLQWMMPATVSWSG
jgi:hypothetical protein